MGVLICDRGDCENIMCDNISHTYGYLCEDCKKELIAKGECSISDFMESKKLASEVTLEWEEYVDEEFKSRYDDDLE